MMKKQTKKYYVVWAGRESGIFNSWDECKHSVERYEGAKYKAFPDRQSAEQALADGPENYWGRPPVRSAPEAEKLKAAGSPLTNRICVDAACNSVTGQMEYQGVYTENGQLLFRQGPYQGGSNNIGEFLALVHALAWCKKHRLDLPVYSDSHTAITWVKRKKANTKISQTQQNSILFDLIQRAENWLKENTWENPVLKWNTEVWGEIPADFGRK